MCGTWQFLLSRYCVTSVSIPTWNIIVQKGKKTYIALSQPILSMLSCGVMPLLLLLLSFSSLLHCRSRDIEDIEEGDVVVNVDVFDMSQS